MIQAPYLQNGDCIAIVAASRFVEEEALQKAISFFSQSGFQVKVGKHILAKDNQFAGTDQERVEDLNWALGDPEIKAIIFFRGGYGAARILDLVDWNLINQNPKWLCGYSDVTAIHQHVNSLDIQSLHSTMPVHLSETDEESILSFHALIEGLKGEDLVYYLESDFEEHPVISGEIIGGNLSVIYSLLGSVSDMNWDDKILFLEDLDEYLYHIDRMMNTLSRAGKLNNLKAILVGSFKDMHDNAVPFGKDAEEIIQSYANKHNLPIFYGLPVGHDKLNIPVKCGALVKIANHEMIYL